MNSLDLIKRNIIWIILASLFFYVVLILFSDASKISEHFINIRIELIFLIFVVGILSHIIKSFRQKDFLQMVDDIGNLNRLQGVVHHPQGDTNDDQADECPEIG